MHEVLGGVTFMRASNPWRVSVELDYRELTMMLQRKTALCRSVFTGKSEENSLCQKNVAIPVFAGRGVTSILTFAPLTTAAQ